MPQAVLDELDVEQRERMWRMFAEHPSLAVFVAEREGEIVGFVNVGACREEDGIGELFAIYVHPDSWDTGAGLALMNAGVGWLTELWGEAVLWVAEENPRARRFYERYGWVADGGRKLDEPAPGAQVAEIRYRLSGLDQR